jgi:fructokinase
VNYLVKTVDVLKLSDDDLLWLTGPTRDRTDPVAGALRKLDYNQYGLVIVTEGPRGVRALWRGETVRVPGFKVKVAETTGCGDAFMAGVISKLAPLCKEGLACITPDFLSETLTWANACAAIVATRYGAAISMPTTREVNEFLEDQGK